MNKLFTKVLEFALSKKLFYKGYKIGIGVSGGGDSVFLLHFFENIKRIFDLDLVVLHFNHKIRLDSDDDEFFVKNLAKKYEIKFFSECADVVKISKQNKTNLEEQARILRYKFFNKYKQILNLDKVATAHTKNDLIETFLINLIRGSSLEGLVSLKPFRDFYIRPMLCIEKTEIIDYLNENNLQYKTDTTNFDMNYTRNRIRIELIEILKTYNPNIVSTLYKEIELLDSDSQVLNYIAFENFIHSCECFGSKAKLNLKLLSKNYSIRSRVLKMTVSKITGLPYSLSFVNINRLIDAIESNKILVLRKLLKAYKQGDYLIVEKL